AACTAVLDIAERRHDAGRAVRAALVIRGVSGTYASAQIALCERARALLGDADDGAHAQVLAQYAFLLAENGDRGIAERASRDAMAMAERSGLPEALVAAMHARHELLDP